MKHRSLLPAILSLVIGVALLIVCAVVDVRDASDSVRDGFALVGPVPDWDSVVPLMVAEAGGVDGGPFAMPTFVVFADFSVREWENLLGEGRLPQPGAGEALAGSLCRENSFNVNGETYTVTGRVRRDVPSFSTVYVVPYPETGADALLSAGARRGFYDWAAVTRTEKDFEALKDVEPLFVHEAVPMTPGLPLVQLVGLGLALHGAAVLQWRVVLCLHGWIGAFGGLVRAQRNHAWMFRTVMILNYATFLIVMFIGALMPRENLAAMHWLYHAFSEGGLKDLGDAYYSGNIPLAAWETFRNNFIVQTVVLSTMPSMVVPFFGVGKTLLSLIVVGFAMAPAWSGSALGLTYHWVTIALELQAYILVSCGICAYTVDVSRAIKRAFREDATAFAADFRDAFEQLASATMYACAALAIAAIFEAVTLIGFNSSIVS